MTHVIDSSQSAPGPDAATISLDRQTVLQSFFIQQYEIFLAAAFEVHPELLAPDGERILTVLSHRLDHYGGPLENSSFLRWAERFVRKEARRYKLTEKILAEQNRVIHAAIHEYLWSLDYVVSSHDDVYQEIAALIFRKALALDKPGRAKLSTRITALVRRHTYYRNKKNSRRKELVEANPSAIRCEWVPPEQVRETKVYDPGYDGAEIFVG